MQAISYVQPVHSLAEYGPDFTNEGSGISCEGLISLDDHMLPHIDPLLTIKPEDNKMYVGNFDNFNFNNVTAPIEYTAQDAWTPPTITKVYQYDESNDANRMYPIY